MTFKSNLVIPGSGEHSGDWKGRRVCRPLCVIDRRYLKITVKIISLYLAEAGPKSWRIQAVSYSDSRVELMRNLMAHAQKPDFIFRLNGRVHKSARESVQSTAGSRGMRISVSNAGYTTSRGRMRVLATHSICQFPLHFPSRASPCATTFRTQYTTTIALCRALNATNPGAKKN